MARGPRVHVPDGWYHVTSRGNAGEAIYRTDEDRRAFLGFVAELPGRFRAEVHAFVLMDNHYHLLLRCRGTNISETLRWLQTAYAVRFNWRHRRRGHVFQGRYKSVLVGDEGALDRVARYIHLNPVRIAGLGLSKEEQRRARTVGVERPEAELVAARLNRLREYAWSSWLVYGGGEAAPEWLSCERIQGGSGGRGLKAQRAALVAYTEEPVRHGRLENPWDGLVAGAVLAPKDEALALLQKAKRKPGVADAREAREERRERRPAWKLIVAAAEKILGRSWKEMGERYGDWGRDGTMAVATRALGWQLAEVVREVGGVNYMAAAQGTRRFWKRAEEQPELKDFVDRLVKMSNVNV